MSGAYHRANQRRRRSLESAAANGGRWCAEAQLSAFELGMKKAPNEQVAELNGYCYYLSKTGQSCSEACDEQMGGECDAAGTEYATHNLDRCQRILATFGGLSQTPGEESDND